MTDNEIIKAWECCMDEMGCTKGCPCFNPKAKGVTTMPNELKPCPFAIGDIVYVLGKYLPDSKAPLLLMECKISHIEHRQFVAHRTDGEVGEWKFSKKHYNKVVFTDKEKALEEWNRRVDNDD